MARKNLFGIRVAILAADGFEQVELTSPVKALQRHGAETELISLRRGKIRGMNLLWPGRRMPVDRTVFTARAENYDALLIPGGHINPDYLRQSERVLDFVREFDAAGKPIAVICHGPWVLASANLVKGRTLTSWPGIKDDIRNAGGEWKDKGVVRDGNWVTAQSPADLSQFNHSMVAMISEHGRVRREPCESLGILSALGWLAAGAVVAAAVYGRRPDQRETGQATSPELESDEARSELGTMI